MTLVEELVKDLEPDLIHVEGSFIPSKQPNFKTDGKGNITGVWERKISSDFEQALREKLATEVEGIGGFPTDQEVQVAIVMGVQSQKKYASVDLDNKAKLILDAFKGPIYADDSQVKILMMEKELTENEADSCLMIIKILP